MGYIINNGIPYGGSSENDIDIVFMDGTYTATNEEDFCLQIASNFLKQTKSHGFINIIWDGNDYFTGTISKYASGSCQMMIGRANQSYIIKAKSNGTTITIAKIS